jgi:hypothetical protein
MKIKTVRRKEIMMRKIMNMVSSQTKKKKKIMRILQEGTGMLQTLNFKLLSAHTNSKTMSIMDLLQVKEKEHNQQRVGTSSHRIDQPTTKRI